MKLAARALVLPLCLMSTTIWAQEDSFGSEEQQDMRMQVGVPGAEMNVKMKVRTTSTTTTTRTTTSTGMGMHDDAPPPSAFRDCGTGSDDPGCTMMRAGSYPMDAESFRGFISALRDESNEITRFDMAKDIIRNNFLTARQFGQVMDAFENEIYKFDVAKVAVSHVVNPKHAIGFSKKFDNSIYGADYTKLIAAQR